MLSLNAQIITKKATARHRYSLWILSLSLSLSLSAAGAMQGLADAANKNVSIKIIDCPGNSREIARTTRLFDRSRTLEAISGRETASSRRKLRMTLTWWTHAGMRLTARNPSEDRVTCYSRFIIIIRLGDLRSLRLAAISSEHRFDLDIASLSRRGNRDNFRLWIMENCKRQSSHLAMRSWSLRVFVAIRSTTEMYRSVRLDGNCCGIKDAQGCPGFFLQKTKRALASESIANARVRCWITLRSRSKRSMCLDSRYRFAFDTEEWKEAWETSHATIKLHSVHLGAIFQVHA